jgi:hypothetical protein
MAKTIFDRINTFKQINRLAELEREDEKKRSPSYLDSIPEEIRPKIQSMTDTEKFRPRRWEVVEKKAPVKTAKERLDEQRERFETSQKPFHERVFPELAKARDGENVKSPMILKEPEKPFHERMFPDLAKARDDKESLQLQRKKGLAESSVLRMPTLEEMNLSQLGKRVTDKSTPFMGRMDATSKIMDKVTGSEAIRGWVMDSLTRVGALLGTVTTMGYHGAKANMEAADQGTLEQIKAAAKGYGTGLLKGLEGFYKGNLDNTKYLGSILEVTVPELDARYSGDTVTKEGIAYNIVKNTLDMLGPEDLIPLAGATKFAKLRNVAESAETGIKSLAKLNKQIAKKTAKEAAEQTVKKVGKVVDDVPVESVAKKAETKPTLMLEDKRPPIQQKPPPLTESELDYLTRPQDQLKNRKERRMQKAAEKRYNQIKEAEKATQPTNVKMPEPKKREMPKAITPAEVDMLKGTKTKATEPATKASATVGDTNILPEGVKPSKSQIDGKATKSTKNIVNDDVKMLSDEVPEQKRRIPLDKFGKKANERTGVGEKISYEPQKQKKSFDQKVLEARQSMEDRVASVENLEIQTLGRKQAKTLDATESASKQMRLTAGSAGRAEIIIEKDLKPIVDNVKKMGYTYEDLVEYAAAVRANEDLTKRGIKTGFSAEQIAESLRKGGGQLESARQDLVKLQRGLLKDLVDSDIISVKQYNEIVSQNPNYIPLFRDFSDETVDYATFIRRGIADSKNPIKKMKGSTRDAIDPMEGIIKNIYQTSIEAQKNKSLVTLSKFNADNNLGVLRKLSEGETAGRKNVIRFFDKGERVAYEVTDPLIYRSLKGLDEESMGAALRIVSAPASLLRKTATGTLEFAVRNPIRDVAQAFINKGVTPLDFGRGLYSVLKKDDLYVKFLKSRGGMSNVASMTRESHRKIITKAFEQPMYKKFLTTVNPIEVLRKLGEITEQSTKLGYYKKLTRKGVGTTEAAYQARDLMDFSRMGTSMKVPNRLIPFLNANVQGKSKFLRSLADDPKGVLTRLGIVSALPSLGAYGAYKFLANDEQRKIIDESPDWQREGFWLVPIPYDNIILRIPKPFEALTFISAFERSLDYLVKNDKDAGEGFFLNQLENNNIINNLGVIQTLMEIGSNYSSFRESPIIPEREKRLPYSEQQDQNTSLVSKGLSSVARKITGETGGGWRNIGSPRVMDYTIKATTAGVGQMFTDFIDLIAGIGKTNKPASKEWYQSTPGLKGITVNPATSPKAMDWVYSEAEKLEAQKNAGNPYNEYKLESLSEAKKEISEIRKEIREINNDPNYNQQQKKAKVDKLRTQMYDIAIQTKEWLRRWKQ